MSNQTVAGRNDILRRDDTARVKRSIAGLGIVFVVVLSCWATGVFDAARFADTLAGHQAAYDRDVSA